uniref:(northern house mosquito) hypothetical protein n=1 Tax=Culex pipiens TaxID=7175 RepID=A0A8D8D323_CULPI
MTSWRRCGVSCWVAARSCLRHPCRPSEHSSRGSRSGNSKRQCTFTDTYSGSGWRLRRLLTKHFACTGCWARVASARSAHVRSAPPARCTRAKSSRKSASRSARVNRWC